ncbi:MAG: adenylate/guanylate cyclase domain-containing protein, partial [Nitriliruptorales bacterium]|nr:adenylate/guanylate cyclase domain-containing protein [Nitriliruptorales bacterium]
MSVWERSLTSLESLDVARDTDADRHLQRTLLVAASIFYSGAGAIWGSAYLLLGEPIAGSIPLGYALLTVVNIVVFTRTQRYRWFRDTQLLLTLLLPFFLQVALGGFVSSGVVILWAFTSPLGALLVGDPETAHRWFLAFVALVVVSLVVQPLVRTGNSLSSGLQLGFLVGNVVAVTAIVFVLLRYFSALKNRAYQLLGEEREKSDQLLRNVLPEEIAQVLRDSSETIAEDFDAITVLFADVVGFTALSEQLSPPEMVDLLNAVFSYFDDLVERHDVEKVRTVGDNYMVVAGAPRRRPDHAQVIARLALDMLEFERWVPHPEVGRLTFRIGINSGPATAGVIGNT